MNTYEYLIESSKLLLEAEKNNELCKFINENIVPKLNQSHQELHDLTLKFNKLLEVVRYMAKDLEAHSKFIDEYFDKM